MALIPLDGFKREEEGERERMKKGRERMGN